MKKKYIIFLLIGFLVICGMLFLLKTRYEYQEKINKFVNLSIEKYRVVLPLIVDRYGRMLEITDCNKEKERIEYLIKNLNESSDITEACVNIYALLSVFAIYCDQKINSEEIKEFFMFCRNSYPSFDVVTLGVLSYATFLEEKEWICNETSEEKVMEYLNSNDIRTLLMRGSAVYYLCKQCGYENCIKYICNYVNNTSVNEVKIYGRVTLQSYKTFVEICKNE